MSSTITFHAIPLPKLIALLRGVLGTYSIPTFYRDAKALGITHAGFHTRPRLYWVKDANRILASRGVQERIAPPETTMGLRAEEPRAAAARHRTGILSLPKLKAARNTSRKGAGK